MGRAGAAPTITMCFLDSQHEGLRAGAQKGTGRKKKADPQCVSSLCVPSGEDQTQDPETKTIAFLGHLDLKVKMSPTRAVK